MTESLLETLWRDCIRAFVYGLVVILMLVGATKLLGDQQAQSVKYLKAIACELALPLEARTPDNVAQCFRAEGLSPPAAVVP